jgi:HEAT repeat protein
MLTAFLLILAGSLPGTPNPLLLESQPFVQEDEALEDKRESVKALLESLKGYIEKRGAEDTEAVGVLDQLVQEFSKSGPKDQASILKGLGKCFDVKRRELEDGLPDNKLFVATAICLGEMGEGAAPVLLKYVGNKKHRKNLTLQRQLILSVGKAKNLKVVKDVVDLLKDKDDVVIASAAEALKNYGDAPLKTRKMIFNELLKILVTTEALKNQDVNDIVSRDRYDTIASPIMASLKELSGHEERKGEDWQRWWNKNKKKDWDEAED